MAKVFDHRFGVATVPDLARAQLDARLPHGRRHGELNSFRPWEVLRAWRRRQAVRRELRWIDDRLLGDAGLDARQAHEEARRPFWRPLRLDERTDR